jgi:PAS domain S-box-containing protein
MPVMDGYTLLQQWRADARLQHIPFIVYTATYTDPKDEQLALSLGASAFILKPAEPADLMAQIEQVLAQPVALPRDNPEAAPEEAERRNLRHYSEVLIHKLEDKMEELDKAKRELQRDLAERRRIEKAHTQLVTAVEQAAEAVVITDTSGVILYVNPAFEKTTGYSRQEAMGQNPRILKSGKHDTSFYRRMWESLAQGKVWSGRITNKKKNGELYEEEMTISPIRDSAGKIIDYVAVQDDVTQEVALEMQLRQAQKLEGIGQLAGGVAHDFNNILTSIQCNASLLRNVELDAAERTECADQILRAAEHAASLTRQLLIFSRKQVMHPAILDLNAVVEGVVKMLQRILGEDIALRAELAPVLPPVFADAGMIEQVLLNRAVNSRDAMPRGGRLAIATGTRVQDEFPAEPHPPAAPGEYVWLSVEDTGCGISPGIRPRIFEPFFTTKPVGKGTGLGLATVHGIVQQHHGWIDIASEVGQGTTFKVYLPVATAPQAQSETAAAAADLPVGEETILLVEDDAFLNQIMSRVLTRCGLTVLSAPNGVAALPIWKEHRERIRLLLTDLVMPEGMTGFELARKLQAEKPRLQVVFTSGYATCAGEGPPLIEGVNFLQKPYSPQKLAKTVRDALDAAKAGA